MAFGTADIVLQEVFVSSHAIRLHLLSELFYLYARKRKAVRTQRGVYGAETSFALYARPRRGVRPRARQS